jgi:hypothetical protein
LIRKAHRRRSSKRNFAKARRYSRRTATDGQRLLMVKRENASPAATHINVVLNWLGELTARVPAN